MDNLVERIKERNSEQFPSTDTTSDPIISRERTDKLIKYKLFNSVFNHSMWLYAILVILDLLSWGFFVGCPVK